MSNFWRSPFIIVCFATLAILLSGAFLPARAANFTVNLNADYGDANPGDGVCDTDSESSGDQCTLRAAIEESNALSGADTIGFAILGTGVETIAPTTALPTITQPVTIDGYTQSGSSPNTSSTGTNAVILIDLNGAGITSPANGLYLSASNCTVRGLVINGFSGNGILSEGDATTITGCFIGTSATGAAAAANSGNGIQFSGLSPVSNNTVGGTALADKNLISANGANGISLSICSGSSIRGNIIGTSADTTSNLGNGGSGIAITGTSNNNQIGDNTISRSGANGISIVSSSNNQMTNNVISFNGGRGVQISGTGTIIGNDLLGNRIYSNSALGIDLGADNVTANDTGDADSGPNNLQNFPVLSPATAAGSGNTNISGTLNSAPNTNFLVAFYESTTADPSGFGEGENFLGATTVTTNASGNVSFSTSYPSVPANHFITATATDPSGNTSEFSASVGVTPALSINDVTVTEGTGGTNNAVFTVTLSSSSANTVTVNYATGGGNATAPADYTAQSGTLTFAPGQTTKTITVPIITDAVDENDENFLVTLSNSTNATLLDPFGLGTITDDDTAGISINDVTVKEGNSGTTNANFTVSLSVPSDRAITVNYFTQDGTATAPSDYTARNGTLTIAAGATAGTISVPVVGDTLDEPNETFAVRLSSVSSGVITDNSGTGTIQDDDAPPTLSINDVSVVEGNSGTTDAVFTITLSAASSNAVQVGYATENGTAISPGDYEETSNIVTIPAGQTTVPITVRVVGDTLDENEETFFVHLTSPTNATLRDDLGEGMILDDDTSNISINNVSVTEGNSGTTNAVFTVSLSTPNAQAITLSYATQDGTATAPTDYTARSGTLTIPAGQTTATVTVPVVGDTLDEPNETFTVSLSNASGGVITGGSGIGTILDDDAPPSLSVNDVTVTEGNSGTTNAVFTVALSAASAQTVTVAFATQNGTATAPSDYSAQSGTLTFAPGQTRKTITVPVIGDTLYEPNETFTVRLSNPTNATLLDAQGQGTIKNDDTVAVNISINDVTVKEGNSAMTNAVFTVSLSRPSASQVTVNYATANGTATAPTDYTARSGTLTIAAGAKTGTISVPIVGDTLDEPNETFTVRLRNASGGVITDGSGTGTILDDDAPPALSINDANVTEGNSGTTNAVFTVALSAASAQTVTVAFTTQDGTAKAPSDYTTNSGTLTFAPGQTRKTITVPVVGDTLYEPNETFTVRLSNPTHATLLDAQGQGTIRNDDVLGLNLAITPSAVTEGAAATATVTRSGSDNAAALRVTLSGSSSRIALPASVVIPAGAASATFSVSAVDNQIADGDLDVTVTASATGFTPDSAAFQVRDNESAGLTLSVSPDAFAENAGKEAAIGTVARNTSSGAALTVSLKSSDNSAATVPATVTIAAGASIATFPIAAVNNDVVDGERSAIITASATGSLSATATVRVADDDSTGRPPNDDFNRAQTISGAKGTVTGTTQGATHEEGEPNHADGDGSHSVWYAWVAPATGTVIFDTEGSAFDTVLGIYTGTAVDDLNLINDDDDGGSGATSRVRFGAIAGQRYLIAVDGFRDEQGALILRWNLTTGKPANDNIASAQVIFGNAGQVPGDNSGATQESGEPHHAGEIGGVSVWYQWTAPASGTATFDTRGSVFDTLLGIYVANTNPPRTNALTVIASNDDTSIPTLADGSDATDGDSTDDLTSRATFEAVAGRTYFIAVDGFQGDQGSLILHWNLTVSSGSPIRWDKKDAGGQGQSGNWNNPDNWLPRRVPQSGDLVSINLPGTYNVNLDVDANVSGIALGGSSGTATLAIADKRLVLRGRSTVAGTGTLQLSGGTLSLASDGVVSGAVNWSGGQLQGVGTLHLLRSAHLNISGATDKALALNVIENDGDATWSGSGALLLSSNARFVNNGQFTSQIAGLVKNQGGGESPKIFNYGTFTSTATGTSQFIGVEFWNAGLGNIQAGTFQLRGGGASYGTFDIATGARLEFSSEFFFAKDASSVIGGGQAEQLGGTFVVNTDGGEPVDVRDFELSDGNLNGANSQSRLEVNEFAWTGGSISGKGQITLKDNFRITGNGSRPLTGQTLTSRGNADWNSSGPLTIGDGADINIQGNLYARDGFTVNTSSGEAPVLNNSGAIKPGDAAPDANMTTRALTPLSTGILNIFCNYHQAASGILNLDVRGTKPGSDYDQVNVRGNLTIDPGAKIEVNLPAGVTPRVGDSYRVLTFTQRSGEFLLDFSKVVGLPANLSLKPVYSANALDLVVVSSIVTRAPFISGRVTDGQGSGLANLTVKRASADNQVVTTTTDNNGYYAFNQVPFGNYFVSPVASGYVFGIASVTVNATKNAPDTNFAGTPLSSSNSSKSDQESNTPSAPSS